MKAQPHSALSGRADAAAAPASSPACQQGRTRGGTGHGAPCRCGHAAAAHGTHHAALHCGVRAARRASDRASRLSGGAGGRRANPMHVLRCAHFTSPQLKLPPCCPPDHKPCALAHLCPPSERHPAPPTAVGPHLPHFHPSTRLLPSFPVRLVLWSFHAGRALSRWALSRRAATKTRVYSHPNAGARAHRRSAAGMHRSLDQGARMSSSVTPACGQACPSPNIPQARKPAGAVALRLPAEVDQRRRPSLAHTAASASGTAGRSLAGRCGGGLGGARKGRLQRGHGGIGQHAQPAAAG